MGLDYALLGDISRGRGDDVEAYSHYQRCLRLWRERENSVNCARVLDSMAAILSDQDDSARGAMLIAAAAAIRKQAGARLTAQEQARDDEIVWACRLSLGEAEFAHAWSEGYALTPRQAIDLALQPLELAVYA
jgi:hypothetical protein